MADSDAYNDVGASHKDPKIAYQVADLSIRETTEFNSVYRDVPDGPSENPTGYKATPAANNNNQVKPRDFIIFFFSFLNAMDNKNRRVLYCARN
jgi:hypothetical protein